MATFFFFFASSFSYGIKLSALFSVLHFHFQLSPMKKTMRHQHFLYIRLNMDVWIAGATEGAIVPQAWSTAVDYYIT